jgi:hypothetical protein
MEVQIANPIYDVVFKYMMEDNAVAKLLVSSIIGEEVISLDPNPQEHTVEIKDPVTSQTLTVNRFDFSAKIKTPDGNKLVIIELQKASLPTDIMRFRGYLGNKYADESSMVMIDDVRREPVPIYTIYFLGDDLKICDTPVLSVFPVITDVATQKEVKARSKFIELLTHKCWIVQISCLKKRRRNELEILLSVFDQANRSSDKHFMNVSEEDFPEKYRPLIRRLKMAASNKEVKKQMKAEDQFIRHMQDVERTSHYEGHVKGLAEGEVIGREKGRAEGEAERTRLKNEKEAAQAEKEAAQAEKEAAQAEKEATAQALEAALLKLKQAGLL